MMHGQKNIKKTRILITVSSIRSLCNAFCQLHRFSAVKKKIFNILAPEFDI
jgi:hypothetical protein